MAKGPLFSIGSLHIQYYGLCMALGIILCFVFLYFTMQKFNYNDESIDKILIIGVGATAFGVFMSMVFQALYDYIEKPSGGFSLSGAMTFQGGLIGGVVSFLIVWNLYVFVIAPRTKIKILQNNMNASLTDALRIIPIGVTIAHAFGRLGCTFAGCCHGGKTDAWYGIWMFTERDSDGFPLSPAVKIVPTQLFECLFLVFLTVVMVVLLFKFKFKYNLSLYAIAYGVWRFLIEFVRKDHRGDFIGNLTPSQFWSIVMVILGIAYIFLHMYYLRKFEKHPEKQPPVRLKKERTQTAAVVDGQQVNITADQTDAARIAEADEIAEELTLEETVKENDAEGEAEDGKSSGENTGGND